MPTENQKYFMLSQQYISDIEKYNELLILIRDDLRMRADDDGVINLSNFIWVRLNEILDA